MGAFDKLFGYFKTRRAVKSYFKMLDGYTPVFTTFDGGVYEMELTRSCINIFATHCSKLQPNITGADSQKDVMKILNRKPNPFMVTSQFLEKCATIYEAQNTLFILPVLDRFDTIVGFYPADPSMIELVADDVTGEPFVRVTFKSGEKGAVELSRCGYLNKFLYHSDVFGEDNRCMNPTLQLLNIQTEGIAEGIKNSASFRFMANVSNFSKSDDLKKERENWVKKNMGPDASGLALFPNTYTNVKQVISSAQVVNPEQQKIIQERVFMYFGCNEDILENKANDAEWAAYYEGKIEPFAIQLSQVMTAMTYTTAEQDRGNGITWSSDRLQYMSNADKLQVSSQMFDRGVFSTNQIMDIWNLPHVPDGDKRYIRKEYTEVSQLGEEQKPPDDSPAPETEENENADTSQ